MDLNKLFDMQKKLDDRIIKDHGLEGKDLLPNLILSLNVELGELANEWQGFKHWKVDPQPKEHVLEEYVDCLHFILSIGLKLENLNKVDLAAIPDFCLNRYGDIIEYFNVLFGSMNGIEDRDDSHEMYIWIFEVFLELGDMLGFSQKQIADAYMEKNKVNHQRQDNHY